ncbi:glycosyltransferase [Microbacterium sp. SA39]|uniref:glycosyltransferase n=1 Tax=Microbacterium sp. SA39 TaxID=1263625 RepID=UPI00061F63D5|nr:Glycosyl transferase family 2 [Microbacterium sp. SA39]
MTNAMPTHAPHPLVDLIIPVHSPTRPIARAVASVVDHTHADVRVNVIAHNIGADVIRSHLGSYAEHARVRLLELRDDIHSPAGPMNHGLSHSDARFLSVMGSDDELSPGAIDSWLALQRASRAEVVIARIVLPDGRTDPYPPVRGGRRTRALDPRKDRLSYRSAPVGLIDRQRFGALRFSEGLQSGEDLAYSTALWNSGAQIAYDLHGPGYLINDDADDRVTAAPRPVAEDFRFLDAIEDLDWFATAGRTAREALVVKLIRMHFFDVLRAHLAQGGGVRAQADPFRSVLERLVRMAPSALSLLSVADRRVLDALQSPHVDDDELDELLAARSRYRSAAALLPRNPLSVLHRQAPLRTLGAGVRAASA